MLASQDLPEGMVKRGSLVWLVCLELMDDQVAKAPQESLECLEEQALRETEAFLGLRALMGGLDVLAP